MLCCPTPPMGLQCCAGGPTPAPLRPPIPPPVTRLCVTVCAAQSVLGTALQGDRCVCVHGAAQLAHAALHTPARACTEQRGSQTFLCTPAHVHARSSSPCTRCFALLHEYAQSSVACTLTCPCACMQQLRLHTLLCTLACVHAWSVFLCMRCLAHPVVHAWSSLLCTHCVHGAVRLRSHVCACTCIARGHTSCE